MNPSNINTMKVSVKGITCIGSPQDFSYAHSVLQSLSCLDVSQKFIQSFNTSQTNSTNNLTQSVITLLSNLNNRCLGNSQEIIKYFQQCYEKNKDKIQSKNVLNKDPFHFLYFLLQFIHLENNAPKDPNFNIQEFKELSDNSRHNDYEMNNLYWNYFDNTQNSLISQNFFTIEKYISQCSNQNCGCSFSYGMKNLFRIDVDKAKNFRNSKEPMKSNTNINLYDCLNYYCKDYHVKCIYCEENAIKHTEFCLPNKVLIFVFERNNHNFIHDIDFEIDIDIIKYLSQNYSCKDHTKYKLKACISFSEEEKYFSDCLIKNINNGAWIRFIDEQYSILKNLNEINQYEPQILIYEWDNENNNFQGNISNQNYISSNNNNNNNNLGFDVMNQIYLHNN